MLRPPPLRAGDVVRVIAPSGPVDPENLRSGVAVLEGRFGLRVRMRDDVTARHGYLAGDDARRLAEWREAVADREARAVLCARGGYGLLRILDRLDVAPLLAAPRWVVGFSDATALHALLNRAGLVTVHAPLVTTLGRASPRAVAALHALLFGERASPCPAGEVVRAGRARGPLLGGSLTLLAHLAGTPFLPSLAGAVLFVEDVGEKPYRLDRYWQQLRLSGALAGLRGVCVGHLTACDADGGSGRAVLRELVASLGVPAVDGVPAGHDDDNVPLPLGAEVTLVAEGDAPRLVFDGEPGA